MGEMAAIGLFWGALSLLAYTYLGYPLLLALVRRGAPHIGDVAPWPAVTVVVAAYNEEACMAQKVHNVLAHDYPSERLDLIVVSDGSSPKFLP